MFGLLYLAVSCLAWAFVHPIGVALSVVLWLSYQANQNFRVRAARNGWRPGPRDDPYQFAVRLAQAADRSARRLRRLAGFGVLGWVVVCMG